MSVPGKSALVLGGTGQVGRHVLREVLGSAHFTRVCEAGRRLTPLESFPEDVRAKLDQRKVDFEKADSGINDWQDAFREGKFDVVFIALATNMRDAKTNENFEKVDKDYVLNAARAAKTSDASQRQRLVYVSSGVANKDAYSFYSRCKAATEQGLADLGYADTVVFRPGFLRNANRLVFRPVEAIAGPIFTGLSLFTDKLQIDVDQLGKSMRIAGERGTADLPPSAEATKTNWGSRNFTVIANRGARALAQQDM